jgi:hypothetical protein
MVLYRGAAAYIYPYIDPAEGATRLASIVRQNSLFEDVFAPATCRPIGGLCEIHSC